MKDDEKREVQGEVNINLGLGGLFKGLGDVINLLSEMAEQANTETTRRGEFRMKGMGNTARGIYGFTVRTGIGGIPRVEQFGNIRATDDGPEVADVREPLVDVFDEDEEIILVVEIPGVDDTEIQIEIQDDILALETSGERKYAREVLLPAAVNATTLQKTYRNGILELRIKKT